MNKKIILTVFLFSLLLLASYNPAFTNAGGAPAGKAGSPGDGATNCLQCHSGPGLSSQTMSVTINGVDSLSYLAGNTYDIVVTIDAMGSTFSKAGFTITAEKFGTTSKVGNWIGSSETQITGGTHVTHTSSSNTPMGSTMSWTFQWTAPAAGTDDVKLYAAGIVGDGDGSNSGDIMVSKVAHLTEDEDSSIEALENQIKIYPNPASEIVNVIDAGEQLDYEVYDLKGQRVLNGSSNSALHTHKLNVSDLEAGLYICNMIVDGKASIRKNLVVID